MGLSASVVSSNKVSAAEVGNTETTTFEIKNNVQSFNQEHLFLESKAGGWLNHIAHTGYWGGGPLGGGRVQLIQLKSIILGDSENYKKIFNVLILFLIIY